MPGDFVWTLARVIHWVIQAYILLIVVRSVLTWMGEIPSHPLVHLLRRLTDPAFRLVHRIIPERFTIIGNIDISPIIIIMVLYLVDHLVARLLIEYAFRSGGI